MFVSPCASQSPRLRGCFKNKSFYHPIAVVFNYPLLDGDVWKHKQKGFQQLSRCLDVRTTLCVSFSVLCHPSNICLSHFQHRIALCTLSSAAVWVCWGPLTQKGGRAEGDCVPLRVTALLKRDGSRKRGATSKGKGVSSSRVFSSSHA